MTTEEAIECFKHPTQHFSSAQKGIIIWQNIVNKMKNTLICL